MIAKRDIVGVKIFESIPVVCRRLDLYKAGKLDAEEADFTLHRIASAIRTFFLQHTKEKPLNVM